MRKILFFSLISIFFTLSVSLAVAQDNSQDRVKDIENRRATSSPTVATDSSKTKQASNISFIEGTVSAINGTILIVETNLGTKTIYTVDSTRYFILDQNGKKLSGFGEIKVNDKILIIGLPLSAQNGTAKIIVKDLTKQAKNFSVVGKIAEVKESSLVLQNFARADLPKISLTLASGVSIISPNKNQLKVTSLSVNDPIVASGTIDEKGNLNVLQIFVAKRFETKTGTQSSQ